VAERVGCSPATIRLWEQQGLITPKRSLSGYRLFDQDDLTRVQRIAYLRNVEKLNAAAIRREFATARRAPGPTEGAVRSAPSLGSQLRRLRLEGGRTLAQVAAATGMSTSFLSSVEREQSGVSVPALQRLLSFYGTTLAALIDSAQGERRRGRAILTRAGKGSHFAYRSNEITIEQLAHGPVLMEVQLFTVQPGGSSEGGYTHKGEEFIYVLEGQLEVWLEDAERYVLRVGDCLYYPSSVEHRWRNSGRTPARLLWVNTPPTF
jgi:DNA-binding transcriptional MerR regulator/quercetin dioxygenase-like cupin family protein